MANNIYPIQIKKRILFDLISGLILILILAFFVWLFMAALLLFKATTIFFYIVVLVFLPVFLLIFLARLGYSWLYLKSIEYSLDNKNFSFRGGVISRFEKFIPYSKIQHAVIYESFWQRVLGLSSVSIATAREGGFSAGDYTPQNYMAIPTGPFIPDLKKEDAEKLKNAIITISNKKYVPVAGV